MLIGIVYALVAGMLWGLVFAAPLMLPDYPAAILSVGRYLASVSYTHLDVYKRQATTPSMPIAI